MRWDVAHRVASIAAVQAHRDYGVDRAGYVDVFAAIQAAGIVCIAQPMPRVLGLYIAPEDGGPGTLLNSGQDDVAMRHDGAHELGHHVLLHSSCFDKDTFAEWGDGSWPDEEKTAEAFAAWFLMPPPAIRAALQASGIPAVREPVDAYQVARWLGTSYAGTVRHLVNVRMLRPYQGNAWAKVTPRTLRQRAQGAADNPPGHVWVLRPSADGATAHVSAGDRLHLVENSEASEVELPTGVSFVRDPVGRDYSSDEASGPLVQVTHALTAPAVLSVRPGSGDAWQVTLIPAPRRYGLSETWRCGPDDRDDDHSGD